MKFRNAHFKNFPMSDAVKISYFELLINDFTGIFINELNQDVMRMTTSDWLLFLTFPFRLLLIPFASFLERESIIKHHGSDGNGVFTTYATFVLYWRNFDDFHSKPYRWEK